MKYSNHELLAMSPVEIYKLRLNGSIEKFPRGIFFSAPFVNTEVGVILTKYLIEEILKWSDEDIRNKLNIEIFIKYKLKGMLISLFEGSPYQAIEETYPGKFKPWELRVVPHDYWNEETAKEATRWLIQEKLNWSFEDVCKNLTADIFKKYRLNGMLTKIFDGSPYKALEVTYPGLFKPWMLSMVPHSYWNNDTAKEATIWLIEEKLKWLDEDVYENISKKVFFENGLGGMLQRKFYTSPYLALENAYPGRFKAWRLNYTPVNYWNKDTAREATLWLIEKKLQWNDVDICNNLSYMTFKSNGLSGMLQTLFGNSPYLALENAYPGKFKKSGIKIEVIKRQED